MRTMRRVLAGAVILALFGGADIAVAAQDEPQPSEHESSALLSFTMPYPGSNDRGQIAFAPGRRAIRGAVFSRPVDSGDPRLSGDLWVNMNWDVLSDSQGSVGVGVVGIDGEDGSWQGTLHQYATSSTYGGRRYQQMDLRGEGAYRGLSAILFLMDNGTEFDVAGMVYPGEPPPMPEVPTE